MPHVVIEGAVSAERVHREVAPFEERSGRGVLRLRESFLARSGRLALLEAIAVEDGVTRRFLLEVSEREGAVTVRIYPPTDPDKTDGVKRLVARVGARIAGLDPGARIARTNLGSYLEE